MEFSRYLVHFEYHWCAFKDVVPCLQGLAKYRLGIISNGDDEQQRKKLKKLGILDYFEVIITSGALGKAKPDPSIFEYACREAKVASEEAFYVGDHFEVDIMGCHSVNMKGVWLNREGIPKVAIEEKVITISSLDQLKNHL